MKTQPTIFVRPAPGMRVRDPVSRQLLAEQGESKPRNSYWERRVLFGDCVEGAAEPALLDAEPTETDQPATRRSRRRTEE